MPIPVSITDLSTTAASNYPQGTDSPSTLDDVQRAHGAFIRQLQTGAVATTANVTAGTINGATVGATTPSTGAFTTLSATGGITNTGGQISQTATNAAGVNSLQVTGAAGAARDIALFGQAGYSNGFTVKYTGTNMSYVFNDGGAAVATISSTGLSVTGALSTTGVATTNFGNANGLNVIYSGGAGKFAGLDIGRTVSDARIAVAGATNDFITGTASGDALFYRPTAGNTWYGNAGTGNAYVSINGSTIGTFSSTGLSVTGALSATGTAAAGAIDINTTTNGAGDNSTVNYKKAGTLKWQVGFNASGLNTDSFDWYWAGSGFGTKMSIDTSGRLLVPNGTVVAPVAFASLPASPVAGQRAMINNSVAAPAFLSTAAGGGSTTVPVFYNGTTWLVG